MITLGMSLRNTLNNSPAEFEPGQTLTLQLNTTVKLQPTRISQNMF